MADKRFFLLSQNFNQNGQYVNLLNVNVFSHRILFETVKLMCTDGIGYLKYYENVK